MANPDGYREKAKVGKAKVWRFLPSVDGFSGLQRNDILAFIKLHCAKVINYNKTNLPSFHYCLQTNFYGSQVGRQACDLTLATCNI